jgi:mono/diheme cytochrome c family protein
MWRVVLLVAVLSGCGSGPASKPRGLERAGDRPRPEAEAQARPMALHRFTEGQVLYLRYCADCHGWEGRGNGPAAQLLQIRAPNLRSAEFWQKNSDSDIIGRVLIGKDLAVPLVPHAGPDTEAEVTAVWNHLRRLPTLPWDQVEAGEQVYDSLCLACHGIYGRGDGPISAALPARPRDLTDPGYQKKLADEELSHIVADGQGTMPGAGDILSPEEIKAVVAFVRILSPGYETYDRFCAACHGPAGFPPLLAPRDIFGYELVMEEMPTFDEIYFNTHDKTHVRSRIQHMLKERGSLMPHFAGELNETKVRKILAYLRRVAAAE